VQRPRQPTDLRRQRNTFNRSLLGLVLFLLVVVGGILIATFYGVEAAVLGVACLAVGAAVIGLLWAIFTLIGKWAGE
jgi:hypothetical protein